MSAIPDEVQNMVGVTVIEDDAQAKAIIAYYGRLEAFQVHPEMPRLWVFWTDTPRNVFVLAAQFRGYEDAKDNGFAVWLLDMNLLTRPAIMEIVKSLIDGGRDFSKQGTGWEWHTIKPEGN